MERPRAAGNSRGHGASPKEGPMHPHSTPELPPSRTCPRCGRSFSYTAEYWHRNKCSPTGLHYICKLCRRSEVREYERQGDRHRPYQREWARRYYRETRLKVLRHYGGDPPRCACCGEHHIEFLAVDHESGGGNKHRKSAGYRSIQHWIRLRGYPPGFRVLCHNCNMARGFSGYCPHEREGC